jgi:hypothetical protein
MESLKRFIEITDVNVIYCLVPMILTLFVTQLIFKNRFETKRALNLVRWIIVVYTILSVAHLMLGTPFFEEMETFLDRATGPYKVAYWFMLISSIILPFTLLIKKLSTSILFLLVVAFLMKAGLYFERFVIIVTSIHRDFLETSIVTDWKELAVYTLAIIIVQGFIIAILMLGVFEVLKRRKMKKRV